LKNIGKKVGYLKGLLETGEFDGASINGKLLRGVVDLLGDLSDRVEIIDEMLDELNDYVESIDDDLMALEEGSDDSSFSYDEEDDEDFDDFGHAEDQLHLLNSDPIDIEEAESLSGCLCPECSRLFFINLCDPEKARYVCPHCGKTVHPCPLTPENTPIVRPIPEP